MIAIGRALDPATLQPTDAPVQLDVDSLTRHAICLGATGSGKTGLCLLTLELLAQAGVPLLAIDPKGDIANMVLVPPDLTPAPFAPWVPDPEARAAAHAAGLAADGRGPADLARWHSKVATTVYTPGSDAGVPVDVLTAVTRAPPGLDDEGLREYTNGAVSALLALIDRPGDPRTHPPAILLAMLLGDAFQAGRALPIEELIPAVVDPPFTHVGSFPVDTFLPRDDRMELARALNAVVSSPSFVPWRRGVPLDVEAWLTPKPGEKTPVTVIYLAHLDDAQRMFFVTLLLNAVVAWTRRLPGSASLRALVYFDEVMGYLPPYPRTPPSKVPVLTLLKQARGVGVGVMLCSQNPVDVDYKAMSNAGTWLIGRLNTRQDRARVVDGLEDAEQAAEFVARLPLRGFWMRTERGTALLRSRHTLALLRGPLTRREVALLGQTWVGSDGRSSAVLRAPPPLPAALSPRWLLPDGLGALGLELPRAAVHYRPAIYARLRVRFSSRGLEEVRVVHRLAWPATADPTATALPLALADAWLLKGPPGAATYEPAPADLHDDMAVVRLREGWEGVVSCEESAETEDGRRVLARRGDVEALGVVLVWVPTRAG